MTAVGTVGAAAAAVYFGGIRDRLRRPSLSLHFDPDNPFDRQLAGREWGSRSESPSGHPPSVVARTKTTSQRRVDLLLKRETYRRLAESGDLISAVQRRVARLIVQAVDVWHCAGLLARDPLVAALISVMFGARHL
jgi:hypothetical protein